MPKDDYFVIVYRILTYLYACFKSGDQPERELFSPEAMSINRGYWCNVMESISNEGYVTGVSVISARLGQCGIKLSGLKITQKGIEYLQDNSKMAKARTLLKETSDIISRF